MSLFLSFDLHWVQKVSFFLILSGSDETNRSLLFYKPFIGSFQIVLLVLFVVRNYNFPQHAIQTFVQLR
jgi:hypothetical protein